MKSAPPPARWRIFPGYRIEYCPHPATSEFDLTRFDRHCEPSEAIHSCFLVASWIASRSLSSGAHSRDPLARNDDRKAAFLYAPGPLYGLRQKAKFLNGIKLIWVVQSFFQKYFRSLLTQITCISLAVPSHRGAARDRHERGAGCGGRGWRQRRRRLARGRRSRVVLTPRRWRQASRKYPRGDGGKKARSPGRARK